MIAIVAVGGLLAGLFGLVRYLEKTSIFFPSKELLGSPADMGLDFRSVGINSGGVTIDAWLIPAQEGRYTVLFCHGNAGNISTRLEKIRLLHDLGLGVLIFDYRGYGKSGGRPTEKGVYGDAQAAYRYLTEELKLRPQQIIIYGESLGGAVAVDLAAGCGSAGLILESTFSNARDMAGLMYPFLPAFLFSVKFDSLAKIGRIAAPKLFFHSRNDEIIPLALAGKLYSRAEGAKAFVELSGPHNEAYTVSRQAYLAGLKDFLGKIGDKD